MTNKKLIISHPEKIMYPEAKITKGQIVDYYSFIAPRMLPYIKNRPLSLKQYPGGIGKEGFFHKHAAPFYPDYIKRFDFPTSHHGIVQMIGVANAQGLEFLAGQNTIEIHTALAKINTHEKPDQIILDFDPSDDNFEKVRKVALICKQVLDEHKLPSFVKTTGSRGLHVHIPLKARKTYDQIKPLAEELSHHILSLCPELATMEFYKKKRDKKVFLDHFRNDHAATAIAVYSLRANKWAGIATPISWDEVKNDKKLKPYSYTIKNIRERVSKYDPWQDFLT